MPASKALPPGSTIGILGGGQLGRMLALAAARLGFRCHVFSPDPVSPAFDVAAKSTVAGYGDASVLSAFARAVDVVTYEFENVDVAAVRAALEAIVPVRPGAKALAVCQDRFSEKSFLARPRHRDGAVRRSRRPALARPGDRHARASRRPEDAPARLRRQGPVGDPLGGRSRRRVRPDARSAGHPGAVRPVLAGSVGHRRARGGRRGRHLRSGGECPPERHPSHVDRARPHCREDRVGGAARSPKTVFRPSTMSASSASSSSWCEEGERSGSSSTRSRRAFTTPATGPRTPAPSRSSRTTSAPSPAGRSDRRRGTPTWS